MEGTAEVVTEEELGLLFTVGSLGVLTEESEFEAMSTLLVEEVIVVRGLELVDFLFSITFQPCSMKLESIFKKGYNIKKLECKYIFIKNQAELKFQPSKRRLARRT